jgi:Mrp family chromosome partitioning ATPase
VLCDLDGQRPKLGSLFQLEGPGLIDVALGPATISSVLVEIPIGPGPGSTRPGVTAQEGRLLVMPFGQPPSEGEFAVSNAAPRIVAELRQLADVVLLDAAPLLLSGEAVAMTTAVDAVLVVGDLRVLRQSMLTDLRRVLAATPAAKLGVIVTGTSLADRVYVHARGPRGQVGQPRLASTGPRQTRPHSAP